MSSFWAVDSVFLLAPGAVFAVAGSAVLGSDALHGAVVAVAAHSIEGDHGVFAAVEMELSLRRQQCRWVCFIHPNIKY